MTNVTLDIISNAAAISVNQDPLGVAGRRVASLPLIGEWSPTYPDDVMAVLAKCDLTSPTQLWRYTDRPPTRKKPDLLFIEACNASDPMQRWDLFGGRLKSLGNGECADRGFQWDPMRTGPCSATKVSQEWAWNTTLSEVTGGGFCLDLYSAGVFLFLTIVYHFRISLTSVLIFFFCMVFVFYRANRARCL
jgi:hypothetical protein